jgi:hypothetical protein
VQRAIIPVNLFIFSPCCLLFYLHMRNRHKTDPVRRVLLNYYNLPFSSYTICYMTIPLPRQAVFYRILCSHQKKPKSNPLPAFPKCRAEARAGGQYTCSLEFSVED